MKINFEELKILLDLKADQYNNPDFIHDDPIAIPHQFLKKEDIEIAGFLAATIAWGQRKTIVANARRLIAMMDDSPYDFIMNFKQSDLKPFSAFVHRTFNGIDCEYFLWSLKNIYQNHQGMESAFCANFSPENETIMQAILNFRIIFFEMKHPARTQKHIANPEKKASAKRLNMFLRWMVRDDGKGVDFGLWKKILPSQLICPLDIHSGTVARNLGLLSRSASDWTAAAELTEKLREFDHHDPVKYDFALFGMGVFEKNK